MNLSSLKLDSVVTTDLQYFGLLDHIDLSDNCFIDGAEADAYLTQNKSDGSKSLFTIPEVKDHRPSFHIFGALSTLTKVLTFFVAPFSRNFLRWEQYFSAVIA